jgi:hypothetical protein
MTIVDEFRRDECRVLDRLVDGELSQSQRRELLAALDDEPGAWRRCALAFLEAQSWRWQLAQMAAEPIIAGSAGGATIALNRNRPAFWGALLAVAASLLVAFGLGTRFSPRPQPQMAAVGTRAKIAAAPQTKPNEAVKSAPATGAAPAASEPDWQTLILADDSSDPRGQIQVRARESALGEADLTELLSGEGSTVPALIKRLEQEGWKVTRERLLLPVDLSDGRRMVVPVEQVDIRNPQVVNF